jgi:hypothetical protein
MTPTNYIDYSRAALHPTPRTSQPNKEETFYPVICPSWHVTQWLILANALRANKCRTCHSSAAGKLGYQATADKHGA